MNLKQGKFFKMVLLKYYCLAAAFLILLFWGCGEKEIYVMTGEDSLRIRLIAVSDSLINIFNKKPASYKILKLKHGISYYKLTQRYGRNGADIILALNRIDKKNLKRQNAVIIPDTFVNNWKYYSPFPLKVEEAYHIPKLIIVSQRIQAIAAYRLGNLELWGAASTGKEETPTPNGLFHTNWKARETVSTFDEEWILRWSFNLDNFEGISIHQYELPGFPASHSCVRLNEKDAEWIYNWAEQWIVTADEESVLAFGTPVIIFGNYDFDSPRPWLQLADNPKSTQIDADDLSNEIEDYSEIILERKKKRSELIAKRDSIKIANKNLQKFP